MTAGRGLVHAEIRQAMADYQAGRFGRL